MQICKGCHSSQHETTRSTVSQRCMAELCHHVCRLVHTDIWRLPHGRIVVPTTLEKPIMEGMIRLPEGAGELHLHMSWKLPPANLTSSSKLAPNMRRNKIFAKTRFGPTLVNSGRIRPWASGAEEPDQIRHPNKGRRWPRCGLNRPESVYRPKPAQPWPKSAGIGRN